MSSKILAGLILSFVITTFGNSLPATNFYLKYPSFFKIYSWAPFCIGPFAFLYVKSVLKQSYKLAWKDYLLFLPMLIYMINRIPFFLLSPEEQYQIVKYNLSNVKIYLKEPEGLFPPGLAAVFRLGTLLGYIIASIQLLLSWRKKILNPQVQILRNIHIYRFLWILISFLFFGSIVAFINTLLLLQSGAFVGNLILLCILSEILLISFYLFTQPKILYGMIGWIQVQEPLRSIQEAKSVEENEVEQNFIGIHQGRNILLTILEHFENTHAYLQVGYTIADLSKETKIPSYLISPVLNQEFGKNFNEFVNDARINYLDILKNKDPNFDKYSIEYIGNSLGFSSRTSFVAAVKKRTGLLPKEYLAQILTD
ncbi:helix-turn-helix domain-containing protein [Aquirufa aurantiipilula]